MVAGTAAKWLIVVVTAVVVIATGGAIFVLASAPALSLSGSSSVFAGGMLSIHGAGFLPGGNVALTLDQGIPVASVDGGAASSVARDRVSGADALFASNYAARRTASNSSIPVGVTGTFEALVQAQSNWSAGQHTIHARENLGSRSADLQFTLLSTPAPVPAKLVISPTSLAFKVQAGTRAVQSIGISNAGETTLNWTATTDGSPWLKLQGIAGEIGINTSNEFIDVTADASQLKVGTYTATIQVNSNGGNSTVAVSLQVLTPSAKKQAKLDVAPAALNFGQLLTGQTLTEPVSVGNLGTADLSWSASVGNASWLTLNTTSGTVKQGAIPQTIQVTADTHGLAAGSYSATIAITSNGGTAQVAVTLVVTGITPTPSLSPTPTLSLTPSPTLLPSPSPTLIPTPSPTPTLVPTPSPTPTVIPTPSPTPTTPTGTASLGTCSYAAGTGWSCPLNLAASASNQTNWTWSAAGSGISGITITPPNGSLPPGQPATATVAIPDGVCPASATITVTNPGTSIVLNWSCAAPTLTVTVNTSNCPANTSGGWTCTDTLSLVSGSQGQLAWTSSASSNLPGVGFNPPSGTLSVGQSTPVTITVPSSDCTNGTFYFAGTGGNTAPVTWTCSSTG